MAGLGLTLKSVEFGFAVWPPIPSLVFQSSPREPREPLQHPEVAGTQGGFAREKETRLH